MSGTASALRGGASRCAALCASMTLALALGCEPTDVELVRARDAALDPADAAPVEMGLPHIPGLRALRITPDRVAMVDDGIAPGETASLRAIGSFDDGERDVTERVAWSLERAELGSVRDGELMSAAIAGRTRVLASTDDASASAELEIALDASIVLDQAPDDAGELFAADLASDITDPAQAPRIVYPSDETMLPQNLDHVQHQWSAPAALDLFELRFDSELAQLRFYTTARTLGADAAMFHTIAASHAGSALTLQVRALAQTEPARIYASQTITLRYSSEPVQGAIYYWSTATEGVMRAHISAPGATKFYTDPAAPDADKCAGCHSVSRDGRRLAVGYDGERLRVVDIQSRDVLIPATAEPSPPPTPPMMMPDPMEMMEMVMPGKGDKMMEEAMRGPEFGWGTFNPGGTRLLYSAKGELRMIDVETGMMLAKIELPQDMRATHPDWSPDGRYVAVSYGASDKGDKNKEVIGSSLARLPVNDDGTLGAPELLLASTAADDTLFFPVFSPDSRWLAFARATGKSKDNATTELFLLAADGSGEPVVLDRLNHAVRDAREVAMIGNTMPTWAPSRDSQLFWLAFSSLRDYGDVLVGQARDQLWAAAIDPLRIGTGEDPSYAAFWLPFQDIDENNHRAFWALASEDECPASTELCDGVDNDCDGVVDDECCEASEEICDDGLDNDCDGTQDEACGCQQVDLCTNGLDDDCDLTVDEDCVL